MKNVTGLSKRAVSDMHALSSSLSHLSASEENLRRQTAPPVDRQNWEGYLIPKSPSYIAAINASEGQMGIPSKKLEEIPLTQPENGASVPAGARGFVDEGKKVDFVLVYFEGKATDDQKMEKEREEKLNKRAEFEENLMRSGLQLQHLQSTGGEEEVKTFVLVHAPWEVLAKHAEEMMIRCPVREPEKKPEKPKVMAYLDLASKVFSPFQVPELIESLHQKKITAFFNRDKISSFLNKDKESFFSDPDRIRIVNRLLESTRYSSAKEEDFGIARLRYDLVYSDAYPIHDGPAKVQPEEEPKGLRQQLCSEWASFNRWYKTQPLNAIKHYLGIRVAFYFAWLGMYNFMLLFAAFLGFWCFVGGLVDINDFIPTKEICDERNSELFYMCPLCDKDCSFWTLTTSCRYSTITHLFDHEGTVFFAIFMSFWATIFLEIWRRKEIKLAYEWDMMNYEDEFQPPRPAFVAKAKKSRLNPVTGKSEPYVPLLTRAGRYTFTTLTLTFMIFLVIAALVGVVVYRAAMVAVLSAHPDKSVQQSARLFTSLTASVINLVAITVLGYLYEWLAKTLTDWENPRTVTDYQDMMTLKLFLFQSVNNYSSLFYIAFFKSSRFIGYPGNYNRVIGGRLEGCDPSGCLIELCIQLAVIMVGKQFISSIQKFAVPSLTKWWAKRSANKQQSSTQWDRDYMLNQEPEMRMFYEYHDMVIQFGFVSLFVAAFPLAPLFALINNIVELRIDAINFMVNFRRPVPQRARGIGAWFEILRVVSRVAVLVNSFVIAFTSEFIPRLVYKYSYSPDGSLNGYVDNSLSYFNVSDFHSTSVPNSPFKNLPYNHSFCRYKEYFEPVKPYRYNRQYYVVLAARLTFVVVFQYFVFVIVAFLDWLIPDVPRALDIKIKRENFIARECMTRSEAEASRDYETRDPRRGGSVDTLYMSCEAIPRARGRYNQNQV